MRAGRNRRNMVYLKLMIEPIPRSSAMASLAKLLPKQEWDNLRRKVYRQARYRCQVCGKDGRLNAHEVWQFNERTGFQFLMGFNCRCADCHGIAHLLNVRNDQISSRLAQHFMQVNKVGSEEFRSHLKVARSRQAQLDAREWHISFGEYSFQVPVLNGREQRKRYVESTRPRYR